MGGEIYMSLRTKRTSDLGAFASWLAILVLVELCTPCEQAFVALGMGGEPPGVIVEGLLLARYRARECRAQPRLRLSEAPA